MSLTPRSQREAFEYECNQPDNKRFKAKAQKAVAALRHGLDSNNQLIVTTDGTHAHYVKQPESRAFYNNLHANGLVFVTTTPNGHSHAKYGRISDKTPEKERVPPRAQHDPAQHDTVHVPLPDAPMVLPLSQDSGQDSDYFKDYAERY
jgi:hypothetical protein